jgi:hypothetical protein
MRSLISVSLITIAACQSGDDGVLRCVYAGTSWRHRLSEDVENCGGAAPPPLILGVAGPGTWVEAESAWTGRVVILGDVPPGARMTQQPCRADPPRDQTSVFMSDCGPNDGLVDPEEPVEDGVLSIVAPVPSTATATACEDESQWRDPYYSVDPGPPLGSECSKYFGTIIRLYDKNNNLISDHFVQLVSYKFFPNEPGRGQFATLGAIRATRDGDVVHVRVPATINPRLARFFTESWGQEFGGSLGVFPSAGSYPERFRYRPAPRTGDNVDLSFDWDPGDATSADVVLVHNLITPIFGQEVSSIGYHPLRLTRDGDAWNVVALDLNEWLDE